MPAPTTTMLNVNLSTLLQTELSQTGVYAYAVYFDSAGNNPTWTTLSDNGSGVTAQAQIPLTIPYTGGKVYFIIQSTDGTGFVPLNDPTNGITTESEINWGNAATDNYRYDSFEVTLENGTGDAGNLTSVEGFGLPMDLSITYQDGTTSTRGYAEPGSEFFDRIQDVAAAALFTYTEGPLAGKPRMGLSPTQSVGLSPQNPTFQASDWADYVASLQVADPGITIAGFFDGTKDANNVYHNPGYFAYTLTWSATDLAFWLNPTTNSQIQGSIKITAADLENSIYSTLGNATIYDSQDGTPYSIYQNSAGSEMNTGLNNQWGAVLTQFLTGFTAGFYGTTGLSLNSGVSSHIDLNNTWNWDPIYSFGYNMAGPGPLFRDNYSMIFYQDSNSYGSGYSDNLMKQYAVGGPLISVYDPNLPTPGNVANINITIYADSEQPGGYTPPVIYNYMPVYQLDFAATDYATPTVLNGCSIQFTFNNGTVVLDPDSKISLDIYLGNNTWTTVSVSGSLWQQWNISQGTGSTYTIAAQPASSLPTGTMQINNVPISADGVAWYRIQVASSDGSHEKIFNLYTTTSGGQFINGPGSLAIDGLANVVTTTDGSATIPTFNVNFLSGVTSSIAPELLVWNTDTTLVDTLQTPNAVVAGMFGSPTSPTPGSSSFVPFFGQDNQVTNTITGNTAGDVAFGWTGLNNAAGTTSWISAYTNKTSATNVAKIDFVAQPGKQNPISMTTTADLDGQWLTAQQQFSNGTYTVTMTEYLASDTSFTSPVAPTSSPLVLTVNIPTFDIDVGLGGNGLKLDSAAPGTAGNWVHLEVQHYALPIGTTMLIYAVNQSGQLIGRDGTVGATLEDAVRATIGSVRSDSGSHLLSGEQSVYLRAGEELRFALLTGDDVVDATPQVTAVGNGDGTINIDVAGMKLIAHVDNDLSNAAVLAASQRFDNQPWVYLEHGATLQAEVVGSSANTNTLGFVRIDVDPLSGDWSVGGVAYGNTDAFRAAVRADLDDGFLMHRGGNFTATATWTVNGASGFYAPVVLSPHGDTFVIGEANRDGYDHIRMFGANTFGIEDTPGQYNPDFDYNDIVVRLIPDFLI